jgi:hypothetical protein
MLHSPSARVRFLVTLDIPTKDPAPHGATLRCSTSVRAATPHCEALAHFHVLRLFVTLDTH